MLMQLSHRALSWTAVLTAGLLSSAAARDRSGWTPYFNERFGFSFRYPAAVFVSERRSKRGDGEVFLAAGGDARLLVGAFENADGHTVASYMSFVRRESYADFPVSYAPRGPTWFVLSGETRESVIYEKVMFSCGGRVISSFALKYPTAEKRLFDPIVEGIENTFRPGQTCGPQAAN
jgi:hypothetical protein